ncbi:HlyD family type I secretion periplasmic adaptor subunit [Limnohabitans sp.]|uniref:HlyD family type I secretion periplasmic adaptor subunit n=1 Tax=Limnohabitans sp. TaxID=1907725 RepID=UPI0038BAF01A
MHTPPHSPPPSPSQELASMSQTRSVTHYGLWSLVIGLAVVLAWAIWAPIDEGVPAQGLVTLDTKRKAIQHLQGGIVKEVLVREGDAVKEGQVLMTLEQAVVRANLESVRQHYQALRAAESRLLAEQQGLSKITWHPDLHSARGDALVAQHQLIQEQLFASRRSSLQASLAALAESLAGQEALLLGSQRMLSERRTQLRLVQEELSGIQDLVKEGYMPRNKELELNRNQAEVSSVIADIESNSQRLSRSTEEVRQRMKVTRLEYQKEIENQLAEIRREVQADAEKLTAVTQDMERTDIRSPAAGQVVGLSVQTVGAVVGPGQHLMDIVPERAPLMVEARIPPHVIDRVKPGLMTDIRFSSFAHSPQLVVEGEMKSISGDLLTDTESHQSYYLARIDITDKGKQALASRAIQPGMTAEVVIRTGERSMLTYLMYPLVRRLAQSMKEE